VSERSTRCCLLLSILLCAGSAQASVEISMAATKNMNCNAGVCSPTAKKAVLNANDLTTMLASGDVAVNTGGSVSQDIEINAALSWTSASRLTLDSYRSITFNRPLTVAGTGALTIKTNDGGSNGDFRFFAKGHVELWDTRSHLTINGHLYGLARNIKDIRSLMRHEFAYIALVKASRSQSTFGGVVFGNLRGTFEGLGNTISNLHIDGNSVGHAGFFEVIEFTGTLRDLHLSNMSITNVNGDGVFAGALASASVGVVSGCTASGAISATATNAQIGGLLGGSAGFVIESSSSVSVSATGDNSMVGGLVGKASVFEENGVLRSYATGSVTGGDNSSVGGLVGESVGSQIVNAYASGPVSGGDASSIGGLIGSESDDVGRQAKPIISASYSVGLVTSGSGATAGGLIGVDVSDSQISNTYWDLDTSGVSDPSRGAGNIANDPGITGLTTAQFQSGLPAGFNKMIWKENATINSGYPYLITNPPPH
jgi:hypothetical protein